MNKRNLLVIEAHWRNSEMMRADEEYLGMKIEGQCDKCGKDLSEERPETLHPQFDYEHFMCDACYQAHLEALA